MSVPVISADSYQSLTDIEHVLLRTDMYLGPIERTVRQAKRLKMTPEGLNVAMEDVLHSVAEEQTFKEIIGNAADNVLRSRKASVDPLQLEIEVSPQWVRVKNYGLHIPVEINQQTQKWAPDMIFGNLRSGSNFKDDEERMYIGKNGIGAKATNIFSLGFMVECADPARGLLYKQMWQRNMSVRGEPEIIQYSGIGYTQVSYSLDFARFGVEGFDQEALEIYGAHAVALSYVCQLPVYFNGQKIEVKSLSQYAEMFFPMTKSTSISYTDPNGAYDLCIIDTPDAGTAVSFVNGMITENHGVHVDAAYRVVVSSIIEFLGKRAEGVRITKADITNHVSVFISCRVNQPKFTSQIKDCLKSPEPKISLPEKLLQGIKKWSHLLEIINNEIERKQNSKLSKNGGKKKSRWGKVSPANLAGTNRSHETTYILTEGDSANSYPVKFISQIPDGQGRNFYGRQPLRGKLPNALNADFLQILDNPELEAIRKSLKLMPDTDYKDPANYKKLHYGRILIFPDPDTDGSHVLGLVLLFFLTKYPSLVEIGYIQFLRIPRYRVSASGQRFVFYSDHSFKKFRESLPPGSDIHVEYFKGLGTSEDHHIREDFLNPRIATFRMDEKTIEKTLLAFHEERADQRKEWILNWMKRQVLEVESYTDLPISLFIDYELIEYSIENVIRAIPEAIDGMKESQRKAFFAALKKLRGKGKKDKVKVAQIASHAAEITCYKHGEGCLADAIVMMTYDFVGGNNMPYFRARGQFGCVDPYTPILTWNGTRKYAKDITTADVLIGDDGTPRHISKVVSGIDNMYNIFQQCGDPYRVNSEHILTLHFPKHKVIYWKAASFKWSMEYYDVNEKRVKSKLIGCSGSTKDAAEKQMRDFAATIPDDNIFDINIQTYLSFSPSRQKLFRSVRSVVPIQWPKQDVPIDPYIFGMWLGDGQKNGRGFASADAELVKAWVIWVDTIGVEVVHNKNKDGHEGYQYGFRRRGATNGINNLIAVGHKDHSSKTCGGCLTSAKVHPACDWIYEAKNDFSTRAYDSVATNGMVRDDMNPFVNILKKYGLHDNKFIPEIYIINDEKTRLELLAGLIDTDGSLKWQSVEGSQSFEISQEIKSHGHIIDAAEYIAKSLGFKTLISIAPGKGTTQKVLLINGDIYRIPTRLPRKRATKKTCENFLGGKIDVQLAGVGEYVGWYLDGNERFLLGDFTVTHNTREQGGADAANPRYTYVSLPWWTDYIFRKEDSRLEKRIIDEGEEQECENFFPILPMHLINGTYGIGSGWSSRTPKHNPMDVAFWFQQRLAQLLQPEGNHQLPLLRPWYKGFTGEIKLKKDGFSTEGKMMVHPNGSVEITELPVGVWTKDYEDYLASLEESDIISDLKAFSTADKVRFTFEKYNDGKPTLKKLKLINNMSYKNMTVLYRTADRGIHPKIYTNLNDLMEDFFQFRLKKYQERKDLMVAEIDAAILNLTEKARYIHEVAVTKNLEVRNRKRADIYADMDRLKLDHKWLKEVSTIDLSEDMIPILQTKIQEKANEKTQLEQIKAEQIWYGELEEFVQRYCREEKCQRSTHESCNPTVTLEL